MSDITRDIDEARAELTRWSDADPTYAELMATYVALGVLLQSGHGDAECAVEARDLVTRTIALGRVMEREFAARHAAWHAQTQGHGRHAA